MKSRMPLMLHTLTPAHGLVPLFGVLLLRPQSIEGSIRELLLKNISSIVAQMGVRNIPMKVMQIIGCHHLHRTLVILCLHSLSTFNGRSLPKLH
jgi:hypothetical protein